MVQQIKSKEDERYAITVDIIKASEEKDRGMMNKSFFSKELREQHCKEFGWHYWVGSNKISRCNICDIFEAKHITKKGRDGGTFRYGVE